MNDLMKPRCWPTPWHCRLCLTALAICSLAVSGCGLREYQERIERTRQRLQQYDAEDQLLGEPVSLSNVPFAVYLRLPREVTSVPAQQGGVSRLAYFPARQEAATLPVLEAYVGVVPMAEVGTASLFLEEHLVPDLQAASGSSKPFAPPGEEDATFRRSWESPQLLQPNLAVRYSKLVWHSDSEPARDRLGKPIPVPKHCFATYRYEIYLRVLEPAETGTNAGRFLFALVFRQLDLSATRKHWQKVVEARANPAPVPPNTNELPTTESGSPAQQSQPSSSSTEPPAVSQAGESGNVGDIFRWLPSVDEQRIEQAKSAALASLRVGDAAKQRLACYR